MKRLLALTTAVVALAAPATGLASSQPAGYRFTTDTLGGNGQAKAQLGYHFVTENSAGQNRLGGQPQGAPGYQFSTENSATQNLLGGTQAPSGYRFVTDTLGGNGGVPVAATGGEGFRWGDAGIGASAAVGAMLILLGASLVLLRKRPRLAV